mgnify:CR=1 FL=1|jgi:hypothetical protein
MPIAKGTHNLKAELINAGIECHNIELSPDLSIIGDMIMLDKEGDWAVEYDPRSNSWAKLAKWDAMERHHVSLVEVHNLRDLIGAIKVYLSEE